MNYWNIPEKKMKSRLYYSTCFQKFKEKRIPILYNIIINIKKKEILHNSFLWGQHNLDTKTWQSMKNKNHKYMKSCSTTLVREIPFKTALIKPDANCRRSLGKQVLSCTGSGSENQYNSLDGGLQYLSKWQIELPSDPAIHL